MTKFFKHFKQILTTILVGSLSVFALAACGDEKPDPTPTPTPTPEPAEEVIKVSELLADKKATYNAVLKLGKNHNLLGSYEIPLNGHMLLDYESEDSDRLNGAYIFEFGEKEYNGKTLSTVLITHLTFDITNYKLLHLTDKTLANDFYANTSYLSVDKQKANSIKPIIDATMEANNLDLTKNLFTLGNVNKDSTKYVCYIFQENGMYSIDYEVAKDTTITDVAAGIKDGSIKPTENKLKYTGKFYIAPFN